MWAQVPPSQGFSAKMNVLERKHTALRCARSAGIVGWGGREGCELTGGVEVGIPDRPWKSQRRKSTIRCGKPAAGAGSGVQGTGYGRLGPAGPSRLASSRVLP